MPAGKVTVAVTTEAADYDLRIVMQINNKNIVANNRTITNDVAPVIVGDRTLVPVRIVTELLGGTADWDDATRTVTLTIDGKVMKLVIDQPIPGFGTSASIISDRTYVPIRYVAEKLGANVEWIAATQQIMIEQQDLSFWNGIHWGDAVLRGNAGGCGSVQKGAPVPPLQSITNDKIKFI